MGQQSWHCECQTGWRGTGCSVAMETSCADNKDNEGGELGSGDGGQQGFYGRTRISAALSRNASSGKMLVEGIMDDREK